MIIEICCSEDSLLGRVDGPYGSDCHVVRVTEKMDLNSYKTRRDLLEVAKGFAKRGVPILVWVSLPCTGGSTWTFVNLTIPQNAPKRCTKRRESSSSYGPRLSTYQLALTAVMSTMPLNGPEVAPTGT